MIKFFPKIDLYKNMKTNTFLNIYYYIQIKLKYKYFYILHIKIVYLI